MNERYDDDFSGGFGRKGGSETERLRRSLEEANQAIAHKDETIQRITTGPTTRGFVVSKTGSLVGASRALISVSQQLVDVKLPLEDYADRLDAGSCVRVQIDTLAILGLIDTNDITGDVATVRTEGKSGECEVDWQGKTRVVRYGNQCVLEPGDRVMVDPTCNVIIRNLGPDVSKFSYQGETGVSWDDIGGLEEAKIALKETFELPFQHPDLYKSYGKKQVKGVMLFGPPGCGKTLLAKAVANSVRGTHGFHASSMIYVRGPELLEKYVGQTESQIRSLFARAREHFKKHRYPAVLFIDEADALLGKRGARLNVGMETTIVPQFLSEMDGLEESKCVILLATNRSDTLDPAVTRDGRIDRKIHVIRPNITASKEIFRLHLREKPLLNGTNANVAAQKAAEFMFDKNHLLYEIVLKDSSKKPFTLGHLVNGAMIAGMVDIASTIAMNRDIESGELSGISIDDLKRAAGQLFAQNLHTNHETELEEMVESLDNVASIEKPRNQHV